MGLLSQNTNEIDNELSAVLRIIRSYYRNDIKLLITNTNPIKEFKLKIIRKNFGYYKFLFLIKIPKEYPYEPLTAEPIIVSKEMMAHFYVQDFKCFKLRLLIDELVSFCHKYDSQHLQTLQISFPATRMYGEKEITTKVFILFNKALSKFNNHFEFDMNGNKNTKTTVKYNLIHNNDYYNDMGISMLNYVQMLNNLTRKHEERVTMAKDFFQPLVKDKPLIKAQIAISASKEIKKHLVKTLYSRMNRKYTKNIYKRHTDEVKVSKSNLMKVKFVLDPCTALSKTLSEIDVVEEISVTIEDNFRTNFNLFEDVLTIQQNMLNEFKYLVEYSSVSLVQDTHKRKIIPTGYKNHFAVVLLPSRKIIPANYLYNTIDGMIKVMIFMKNLKTRKFTDPISILDNQSIYNTTEAFLGVIEEVVHEFDTDINFIASSPEINTPFESEEHETFTIEYFEDSESVYQSFLKNRIAQQLLLNGDYSQADFTNDTNKFSIRNELTHLYADIISEVIHFPKSGTSYFDYTLRLNPRSNRHRNLLDSIGLLRFKHYSQLEIVAPTDYNLRIFFIKEIFNPNGRGVVIKLHRLSPDSLIYKLVVEENNYLKKLSETNKSIWCSETISQSNFEFLKLIFSLGKMYFEKVRRRNKMRLEAQVLNCSELSIQRYYFSAEMIDSLSIFTKNL